MKNSVSSETFTGVVVGTSRGRPENQGVTTEEGGADCGDTREEDKTEAILQSLAPKTHRLAGPRARGGPTPLPDGPGSEGYRVRSEKTFCLGHCATAAESREVGKD